MPDDRLAYLRFDSSALPPDQQFPAWTALLTGYEAEIDSPEQGFKAVAEAWRRGPVVVTAQHLGPMRFHRSREVLSADGLGGVTLSYLRSGRWRGELGRRPLDPPPGSVCIMDLTQTFWADTSETFTVLAIGALRELLVACLRDGSELTSRPAASGELLSQARAHIDRHLQEPLTVAEISRGLGVSRSNLYNAFAPVGGVASELRRRRLMGAHQAICRPSTGSIADVAHACGLGNPAHFSRAFRREFGATPAAVRAAARRNGAPPVSDGSARARFGHWKALLDTWMQDAEPSAASTW